MCRHENQVAVVFKLAQKIDYRRFRFNVDSGKGLVEQDDFSPLRQSAREEDPLFLPAGKLADLPVFKVKHLDALKAALGNFFVFLIRHAQKIHIAVASHHNDVPHTHGKRPVHFFRLRHVGKQMMLLRQPHWLAANRYGAVHRFNKTHDRFKKRGLAAAVYADERRNRSFLQAKRRIVERNVAVIVRDAYVLYRKFNGNFRIGIHIVPRIILTNCLEIPLQSYPHCIRAFSNTSARPRLRRLKSRHTKRRRNARRFLCTLAAAAYC